MDKRLDIENLLKDDDRYKVVSYNGKVRKGQVVSDVESSRQVVIIEVDYGKKGQCVVDMDLSQAISNGIKKIIGKKLAKIDKFLEDMGYMRVYLVSQETLGNKDKDEGKGKGEDKKIFTIIELNGLPFVFKGNSFMDCLDKLVLFIDIIGNRQLKKYTNKFLNGNNS